MSKQVVMYTDGGARGNPGPAGAGAVVLSSEGDVLLELKRFLGTETNNVAEYTAIVMGLQGAQELGATEVSVSMDSELAVRQLNGVYRVRNATLMKYYLEIQDLVRTFDRVTFTHVRREKNKHADRLVNEAIDAALH